MILEYEEKMLELIDSKVETASDDELFAGGYLRGHISLSAAACEAAGETEITDLKVRIEESLEGAKSELTPADRIIVSELWHQLHKLLLN
ncbi:hypothetical protein CW749_13695 [Vibrio sp. vnigr-6D03]|uniref:YfcL family protein n=1 Tax=Vibrio penaeicida TaxID=104609 RepID=A0AAV5NY98_9VIBR|nr:MULTISPECIES: YfcL family protein [Vibrio]MDP2575231.1 YfcL family protein [Vibrio penaeicida]PKF79018.1 hypothetical protein CW749_13695 [Vibrio sp. vnigr-6D03]RTZ23512.1 YfcL family protein [Vibrio penaeicida]GLQ75274.1 hypothetical protein GCM10007932_46360 [Vibrio penaeicida]